MNDAVLSFSDIRQDFPAPGSDAGIRVIDGINLDVGIGRFVAVIGPSGCGKSTLLQMAAGLLMPTRGTVHHRGRAINTVNREVGFVPQQAQLFPWKTLAQNVELRCCCAGWLRPSAVSASRQRSMPSACRVSSGIFPVNCPVACRSADQLPELWCTALT